MRASCPLAKPLELEHKVLPVPAALGALYVLVPGDLQSLTGGYGYDRQMVQGLQGLGWSVQVLSLQASFPWPDSMARQHAADVMAAIPDGALVLADGLAFGAMPDLLEPHATRLHWVALVHHPLALETGLSQAQARLLADSERRALGLARSVVVTSAATARALQPLGVEPARVRVVIPGTAPAPLATGSIKPSDGLSLLCVATVTPRKGHLVLIEALAGLQDRVWTLHCIGSTTRDKAASQALRDAVQAHGLQSRVVLHGEVSAADLARQYALADVFVLPSFHEGYGMALAEALARGLPVVSSQAGAIADTVPADAGVLLPPGDVQAWREAMARLLDEPAWRHQLAQGARRARLQLPDWPEAVAQLSAVLQEAKARGLCL